MPRPNLQIIGVQKSGTTALASFLEQHPDICLVKNKEGHVFDDRNYVTSDDKKSFAYAKYERLLSHWTNEKVICDATPITLFHPDFLDDCIDFNPAAKFIVMLRDPVERAFSHFQMSSNNGVEHRSAPFAYLREIIKFSGLRNQTPDWDFVSPQRDNSYLARGCYVEQLSYLFQKVDKNQVLVICQQDLLENHQSVLTRVFSFCGVPDINVEHKKVFETTAQSITRLERWFADTIARGYFLCRGETKTKLQRLL